VVDFGSLREVFEELAATLLDGFSAVGVLPDGPPLRDWKSIAVPWVFGVFEAPKDANAPDPRPNALEAPVVGDVTDAELKGFLLLCDEVSPLLPSI
jgi:hypothetical protein